MKAFENQKGRLTPVFLRRDIKSAQKEVKKNGYGGRLASETLQVKTGISGIQTILRPAAADKGEQTWM